MSGKSALLGFKGPAEFEEFWGYLKDETPRGRAVVVAAFFDERLGDLLGGSKGSIDSRINKALKTGWLTPNEHADLHAIRKLRNAFAHDLRAKTFDAAKTAQVEALRTWQIALEHRPPYARILPTPEDRLLYAAAVIALRLNRRKAPGGKPLPEPRFLNRDAWPPLIGWPSTGD